VSATLDEGRKVKEPGRQPAVHAVQAHAVSPHSGVREPLSPLIAIVGPTAAGKTALSIELAEATGGEIVSADSRQIYRGMDIGTAKATAAERARVPHHLLDVVAPDQVLTLAEYQHMAYEAIAGIRARGRLPFLVGGTGQYVHAVIEGWRIPQVAPQPGLRAELEAKASADGAEALHAWLAALDPTAAARIDYRNVRRVIRALEVCLVTGQPISELQQKSPPPFAIVQIGVARPRPELYARIDARVDQMIEAGLVAEVRRLVDAGYTWELPALTGLGYRQIGEYLRDEVTLAEAVARVKQGTRRFVQQQYNWFRPADPAIYWVDPGAMSLGDVLNMASLLRV
jgi:tRNA dimethylallyltransferase